MNFTSKSSNMMMNNMQRLSILFLVFALGHPSSAATGSSSGAGSKEIDQMYNKIFSSSGLFSSTIAPATTQQWLEQLKGQLEGSEEGNERKTKNVERLLAFSEMQPMGCDLSSESGNNLVANYQYFTVNSTPSIKAYIANCLAHMYEQCSKEFVLNIREAVERLKNSPDFERVSRFKELVAQEFHLSTGFKQNLSASMKKFILEQTDERPRDKKEFKRLFKQSVSGLCETVRRELDFMMYFDVLLTLKQVRAMGEFVVDWYKVRSVCNEVINERRAVEAAFKHVAAENKQEDAMIESRYERIFARTLWSLKPNETLEWLEWLDDKLATKVDKKSLARKKKVAKVIELKRKTQQCDLSAAGTLNWMLDEYELEFAFTIKKYLKHLRDMMFSHCQSAFTAEIEAKIKELPNAKKIFRLKELIVKKFDPASKNVNGLHDMLLEFMDEQAGAPLSSVIDSVTFADQFKEVAQYPCQDIFLQFYPFGHADNILRRELVKQMDPIVRDWFVTYKICSIVQDDKTSTSQQTYERLLARGSK